MFHSFINSHLLYCLPIWSCGLESSLDPLIILQKKAIIIITNSRYSSHTAPLFKKLQILPLKELTIYTKLTLMYDFIRWKLPYSFDGVWIRNFVRNPRALRNSNQFYIPTAKFKCIERFPLFHFQRLWNNICHENNLLCSKLPKKIFCENLKKELFKSVVINCSKPRCIECI